MSGLILWGVIIFIIYYRARKKNEENKRRRDQLQEQAMQQQSTQSSSKTNRALQSVRQAMQQMQQLQPSYQSPSDEPAPAARQTVPVSAAPQKKMPIENRRRQQQEASDRSRIHQSLHRKEEEGERAKAARAAAEEQPQSIYQIRFAEGELMDEVYNIMACGYPGPGSGQRDFLAEGQALLDRYSLPQ